MAGLGQDLMIYDEKYFGDADVPQNTSLNSNAIITSKKGVLGSINVKAVVATEISLADTKALTLKLQDSADGETFADVETLYTKTASGAETISAGDVLCQFVLPPSIRKYTRLVLSTTDADAEGSVNAYPQYLPR